MSTANSSSSLAEVGQTQEVLTPEEIADMHAAKRLDVSRAAQGLWLVKVPKYLAELWSCVDDCEEVAKLCVKQSPGGKSEVLLLNSERVMQKHAQTGGNSSTLPREHKFLMQSKQQGELAPDMHVICHEPITTTASSGVTPSNRHTRVAIWGKVKTRAECRPADGVAYMSLKRRQLEETNKPTREVEVLQRAVRHYRPVADHKHNIEYVQRKKEEGKRSRHDRDDVLQALLSAFEKHQYYNIHDLVQLTQQPLPYLKEILKDVANYNMKAPHKNLWELKPEFRHYKSSETSQSVNSAATDSKPASSSRPSSDHSDSKKVGDFVELIDDDDDDDDDDDEHDDVGSSTYS